MDAIGFVFAPSPRQVTPGQAAQLAALAPPGILRIAVAQHPLQMKVDEICRILKPDYFQTDVEDLRELKIPAHIKVLPVVRFGRKTPNPLPGAHVVRRARRAASANWPTGAARRNSRGRPR